MQRFNFYSGLFLITAATLMLQVIQTRIMSVVSWYHLAFFVISIAMFGLTAGAVWVYLRRDRFVESTLSPDLAYFSGAFAVTTAVSLGVQMTLTPVLAFTATAVLIWVELALCMAVPFFFSGVVVSLALTRSPYPIGRVYGVDLAGAALGCLGALAILNATDGPTAILWVSAIVAAGAVLFSKSGIGATPEVKMPFSWIMRRSKLVLLVLLLCGVGNNFTERGLRLLSIKGNFESLRGDKIFEKWNSFSRIAVYKERRGRPALWGPSPKFNSEDWTVTQRGMNVDGDAVTVTYRIDGDVSNADFLKYDVTNLAYYLPNQERSAVIGIGGGRDMLSARVFDIPDITGVEINPIFVDLLTKEPGFADFSCLNQQEGMTFVVDEARSWFARTKQTFDILQMSLIDTWAATGAGAFTLSENGLYTLQAWRMFLDRLTPEGVFTVSRWYSPGAVNETGRMVSLAMATIFDAGAADPSRHIFLASSRYIATLVLSKSPFSESALDTLEGVCRDLGYNILISPNVKSPTEVLQNILASRSKEELIQYTSSLPLDLTPPTDDNPFFFNQLRLSSPLKTLRTARSFSTWGVTKGNLFATITLAILFLISALLVFTTIVVPLRPAIRDVGSKLAWGGTAYFFLIGVGFMSTEIGLLQRMSIFLGHPIYSLSIVLFSLILATGLGSILSDKFPLNNPRKFVVWSALTGGYLFSLPLWLPAVVANFDSATLLLRASLCVLLIAPAGVLMGYGFPTGMQIISSVNRTPTPWFWGINGAAGVLASTLSVACSIAFGISTTLMIGALCYLLLIPATLTLGFRKA